MDPSYVSEEFFHFVGQGRSEEDQRNYETLVKVIREGCVSHPPHEVGWGTTSLRVNWDRSLLSGELVVPTVTCFCDIPFDQLAIHVAKYGQFGVSFHKNLLVRYGARPVLYVPISPGDWESPFGASLLRKIEVVFKAFQRIMVENLPQQSASVRSLGTELATPEEVVSELDSVFGKDFLAFIKPFDSTLAQSDANNFYVEREWRKFGNLCFEATDIKRVVVKRCYVDRAKQDLPDLAQAIFPAPAAA